MIPQKYSHILFGMILSGLMSCLVSGIATFRAVGFVAEMPGLWFPSWLASWAVSFPTVLVVAPLARSLVARLTTSD